MFPSALLAWEQSGESEKCWKKNLLPHYIFSLPPPKALPVPESSARSLLPSTKVKIWLASFIMMMMMMWSFLQLLLMTPRLIGPPKVHHRQLAVWQEKQRHTKPNKHAYKHLKALAPMS